MESCNLFHELFKVPVSSLINDGVFINNLTEAVTKSVSKTFRDILNKYEVKVEKLVKENEKLASKIDQLEQCSRRCSARILGIRKEREEKLRRQGDCCAVQVDIRASDIERCHRVIDQVKQNRAEVFKFVNYKINCTMCKIMVNKPN